MAVFLAFEHDVYAILKGRSNLTHLDIKLRSGFTMNGWSTKDDLSVAVAVRRCVERTISHLER